MILKETEAKFSVRLIATQDDTEVCGNAMAGCGLSRSTIESVEDEILERLGRGDVWAWAQVEVQVTLPDGRTGSAYLGCCSYEDEDEFKRSGYYEQMISDALVHAERLDHPVFDAPVTKSSTTNRQRKRLQSTLLQGEALFAEVCSLLQVIESDIEGGLSSPSSANLDWMDLSKVRDLRERLEAWQPDPITADAHNLYATIRKLLDDITSARHSEELYGGWLATARQAIRRATGEEVMREFVENLDASYEL